MATQDIQTSLYNGKHRVIFKVKAHRYYIDDEPRIGVTTVLGKVLAKPQLMLWPLNMAMAHMRENIVPTVRYTGTWIDTELEKAYKAHSVRRDKGSDTGSIVHGLVEEILTTGDNEQSYPDASEEVRLAIGAFQNWFRLVQPTTVAVEQVVFSEALGYAGTYDSILELDGKTYLVDLKTTNAGRTAPAGIYPENFIQLGAYAYAYEEQRKYEEKHGGSKLKELDDLMIISAKKDGKLHTKSASELGLSVMECARLWEYVLSLYDNLNQLGQKLQRSA